MASIQQEVSVAISPAEAWDAVRDVGALHTRLVPGFVTNTELVPGARIVTFGNGTVAKELIVTVDDAARRLVWAISNERLTHYNASMQVFDNGNGGSRMVWTADLLPDAMAGYIGSQITQSLTTMKRTLEKQAA